MYKIEKLEELDKTKLKKIENLDKMDVIKNDTIQITHEEFDKFKFSR